MKSMKKRYLTDEKEIIKELKNGNIIKADDGDRNYYLIDGILVCNESSGFFVGAGIHSSVLPYIEIEEQNTKLKLEVGKLYKTRGGKKAFCYYFQTEFYTEFPYYIVIANEFTYYKVTPEGRYEKDKEVDVDIVAQWEEDYE